MLFQLQSTRTAAEIEQALRDSAVKHRFGVIAALDLQGIMQSKGVHLDMECKVFEVCDPHVAKQVLDVDGLISTALPCRISMFGSPGNYTLATMLPTAMISIFGRPELEPVAKGAEDSVVQIMRDAAG